MLAKKIEDDDIKDIGSFFTPDMLMKYDLALFAERMLSMEVSNHHILWASMVAKYPKLAINAPRDHGKSFFFSFAYVIWRVYYNWLPDALMTMESFKSVPRISIGYIFSNTVDQAVLLLDISETCISAILCRPDRYPITYGIAAALSTLIDSMIALPLTSFKS